MNLEISYLIFTYFHIPAKAKVDGRKFLLILCSNKWCFSRVCCLCFFMDLWILYEETTTSGWWVRCRRERRDDFKNINKQINYTYYTLLYTIHNIRIAVKKSNGTWGFLVNAHRIILNENLWLWRNAYKLKFI